MAKFLCEAAVTGLASRAGRRRHGPVDRRLPVWLLAAVWLATGCVTAPDKHALQKVKTVAIIGFLVMPQDKDVKLKETDHFAQDAEALYLLVSQRLQKQRHWQLLSAPAVARDPAYRHQYGRLSVNLMSGGMRVRGILSPVESVNIPFKDRQRLVASLRVDALVSISFTIANAEKIPGRRRTASPYEARVSFDVYTKAKPEPVWTVSSLPARKHGPLPAGPDWKFPTKEEAYVAQAVNDALSTLLAKK